MTKCTRNYYDDPVQIRATKLIAAEKGYDDLMASLKKPEPVTDGRKAAIIGGGPTGIAAAYFLGRAGIPVTVFEQSRQAGRHASGMVIPGFRISEEAIDKDIALMQVLRRGGKAEHPRSLRQRTEGHGLHPHLLRRRRGEGRSAGHPRQCCAGHRSGCRDLKAGKEVSLGHVAVVGGGNTAMDAARAALRAGAKTSTLVYRRTQEVYARRRARSWSWPWPTASGFLELVAPVEQANGKLKCESHEAGRSR